MKIKNTINLFIALLFLTFITSCGISSVNKTEGELVKPESTTISGDLSDYLQVVDKDYEIIRSSSDTNDAELTVTLKVIKAVPTDELNENSYVGIGATLLGGDGNPVSENDRFYMTTDVLKKLLSDGTGQTVLTLHALKYSSKNNTGKAEKFNLSSTFKN